MFVFQKISYKNFLSAGNQPVIIDFDKFQSCMVYGHNGAGKSTILAAVYFALFGKTNRNVNKSDYVNRINNKDCLVELNFSHREKDYFVRRGIKPNLLEIFENGIALNQDSHVKDFQNFFEEKILGFSYKTFNQIACVTKSSYIPFLSLKSEERKNFIENLLDLQVFTAMNDALKHEISEHEEVKSLSAHELSKHCLVLDNKKSERENIIKFNDKIKENFEREKYGYEAQKTSFLEKIASFERAEADFKENIAKRRAETVTRLAETRAALDAESNRYITELEEEHGKFNAAEQNFIMQDAVLVIPDIIECCPFADDLPLARQAEEAARAQYDETSVNYERLKEKISNCKYNKNLLEKEINNLEMNMSCPTCNREYDDYASKEAKIAETREKLSAAALDLQKLLDVKIRADEAMKTKYTLVTDAVSHVTATERKISDFNYEARRKLDTVRQTKHNLKYTFNLATDSYYKNVARIEKKISDTKKQLDNHSEYERITYERFELSCKVDADTLANNTLGLKSMLDNIVRPVMPELTSLDTLDEHITVLENFVEDFTIICDNYVNRDSYLKVLKNLLRDDGFKAALISEFMPQINANINFYAEKLGLHVQFTMNETFDETIKVNARHEYKYDSLSEGEKQRIDLSIMFAFRNIAVQKNSCHTNVLFFDEVDVSLDESGLNDLFEAISILDTKIVYITHKTALVSHFFDTSLEVRKNGNFTEVGNDG